MYKLKGNEEEAIDKLNKYKVYFILILKRLIQRLISIQTEYKIIDYYRFIDNLQ